MVPLRKRLQFYWRFKAMSSDASYFWYGLLTVLALESFTFAPRRATFSGGRAWDGLPNRAPRRRLL